MSFGRISARAPQIAPLIQSRAGTSTPVLPVRRASSISPGTGRVCTVCFAVFAARFSPCVVTFLRMHVRASVILLLRARTLRSFAVLARVPALSPPPQCDPFDHVVPSLFLPRALVHAAFMLVSAQSRHEILLL
jgi:hypothetical protein